MLVITPADSWGNFSNRIGTKIKPPPAPIREPTVAAKKPEANNVIQKRISKVL